MPIYKYVCLKCGQSIELFIRTPLKEMPRICPHCNGELKKVPSTFNFKI